MRIFTINKNLSAVCDYKKTRYGFKHSALLFRNNIEQIRAKACYYNRTWEAFQYQSVLKTLLEKAIKANQVSKSEIRVFEQIIKTGGKAERTELKSVGIIAKMGDIFGKTAEEKNNWKKRMLRAGLEKQGLSFPDDFDLLSEQEKGQRLDGAIGELLAQ